MRYSTFAFVTLFVAAAAPALAVPVDLWTRFDGLEPRHNPQGRRAILPDQAAMRDGGIMTRSSPLGWRMVCMTSCSAVLG
ncbi:uncharacterized protein B0H18DRAFT_1002634, partial [Fomitopsis serialis]|uniref:uncharacterized protein n=1 Tax=Fomitopsis serialis TaxID=139415 RepID=UPI00200801FE